MLCFPVHPLITKLTRGTIRCFRNLLFYDGGSLLYVHEKNQMTYLHCPGQSQNKQSLLVYNDW